MITVEQKENSHVFSIMKGLGIIFVVVGHTSYSPVHNFVYLFHLAVFYFVAGYFFKDKYIDDKLLFLWKKIKSLYCRTGKGSRTGTSRGSGCIESQPYSLPR